MGPAADEPTGALDSRAGHSLLSYLRDTATQRAQTIVMVTHDPNAAAYADRALILEKGEVRWEGPIAVLEADEAVRRAWLTV